ncbi:MAG TPA: ATP-binding cassette domain-containing protein [Alphaproteobacteria bacterium]|nr:ATP-binding cassette domain-containing protein [Alphaproteobacteria bacterium]
MPRSLHAGEPPARSGADYAALGILARLMWREADRGVRGAILLSLLLVLASAAAGAALPVVFKFVIDRLAVPGGAAVAPTALVAAYIGVHWLGRAAAELRWFAYGRVEQRIQAVLAQRVYDRLQALSLRFHTARRTGALHTTVVNGLAGYRGLLGIALFQVLPLVAELAAMAVVLLHFFDPVYLGVLGATVLGYLLVLAFGTERLREPLREGQKAVSESSQLIGESLLNYETVKYFDGDRLMSGRFAAQTRRAEGHMVRYFRLRGGLGLLQATILALGLGAILALAAGDLAAGAMTLGGFVLVNTYLLQLVRPLELLGFAFRDTKQSLTYVEAMLALLAEPVEVADRPGARPLPAGPGAVRFEGVSFAYDPRRPVLRDVGFEVPPGRTVALVGPSGGGKSTVARLLFRFYEAGAGRILIDGADIAGATLASLRAAIAVVPQDVVLFNDSLYANIAFAKPDAPREAVEAAARLARIHDFIAGLPDGYDTVVGERGLKLSGGEKQRVAIARAILKGPRIFVFDEATSALDSATEQEIQANIREVSRGTTTLVVAHRLSTVTHADLILVLEAGRIVERGRHAELLALGGRYAALWRRQEAGFDAARTGSLG